MKPNTPKRATARKTSRNTKRSAIEIDGKGLAVNTSLDTFSRNMLHHSDESAASESVSLHAGDIFDQKKEGRELILKQDELVELDIQVSEVNERIEQQRDKLNNTKRTIKTSTDKAQAKPFKYWQRYDQICFSAIIGLAPVILVSGAANVYANLLSSGEPIFLQQPMLAVALSLIAPAGSLALKFITNVFEYQSTKKRYALGIAVLMWLVFIAWTIAFSMNFTGIAGGMNMDDMMDTDNTAGIVMVWLQLIAEILIGTSLVLSAEDIYLKYYPPLEMDNPDYTNGKRALKEEQQHRKTLRDSRAKTFADITQLTAARNAFVDSELAQFKAARASITKIQQI